MGEKVQKKKIFAEGVTHKDLCDMFTDLIIQSETNEELTVEQSVLCQFLKCFLPFIDIIYSNSIVHLCNYLFFNSNDKEVEK